MKDPGSRRSHVPATLVGFLVLLLLAAAIMAGPGH